MIKPASLAQIKTELQQLPNDQLLQLCLRLARFKHDNKELLDYLLFAAHDVPAFAELVKDAMTEEFATVNTTSIWFAKKTIRKIQRQVNKYVRFAGNKELEIALHLHFLESLLQMPEHIKTASVMDKLARSERQKIGKLIKGMHEDLQYDYRRRLDALRQGTD